MARLEQDQNTAEEIARRAQSRPRPRGSSFPSEGSVGLVAERTPERIEFVLA
jgi:hypothetical protein